jgi:hypothetical protein
VLNCDFVVKVVFSLIDVDASIMKMHKIHFKITKKNFEKLFTCTYGHSICSHTNFWEKIIFLWHVQKDKKCLANTNIASSEIIFFTQATKNWYFSPKLYVRT